MGLFSEGPRHPPIPLETQLTPGDFSTRNRFTQSRVLGRERMKPGNHTEVTILESIRIYCLLTNTVYSPINKNGSTPQW